MRYNGAAAKIAAEFANTSKCRLRANYLIHRRNPDPATVTCIPSNSRRYLTSTTSSSSEPPENVSSTAGPSIGVGSSADKETHPGETAGTRHLFKRSPELQRAHFQSLMRTVPHPVAIITARKQIDADDVHNTVGATVSSFNTVSFDPDLIVSFNLKTSSITYQTICETKYFTVSFPKMNSAGAKLTSIFTKGNYPSPFVNFQPDQPIPIPRAWLDRNTISPPLAIEFVPPAVQLEHLDTAQSTGLAFAFLCEYQTSIPVGDHAIVTGRVTLSPFQTARSGWGSELSNAPFVQNQVTLAHVHGTYSSSDTGLGFSDLWRLDDDPPESSNDGRHTGVIGWYEQRLKFLEYARRVKRDGHIDLQDQAYAAIFRRWAPRIATMKLEAVERYYQYYTKKLNFWLGQRDKAGKRAKPAKSQVTHLPAMPLDHFEAQEDDIAPSTNISGTPFSELSGAQQLLVRNKILLSAKELEDEIEMYSTRLASLPSHDTGDSVASPPSRDQELRAHFEERLQLLRHALERKAEQSSASEKSGLPRSSSKSDPQHQRLMGVLRNTSIKGLKDQYRRYQLQVAEARVNLLGLSKLPADDPDVLLLRDRINFFQKRIVLVGNVIIDRAKRVADKEELKLEFRLPTVRPLQSSATDGVKDKTKRAPQASSFNKKRLNASAYAKHRDKLDEGIPAQSGESTDQLDTGIEERTQTTNAMGSKAVPRGGRGSSDAAHDFLVIKHSKEEEMPSPEDVVDIEKLRLEREKGKVEQP